MRNLILCITLCLTACATTPPARVSTPSGVPEVMVRAPKSFVADRIAQNYASAGWTIKSANEYSVVVEKPAEGMGSALLFGSRFNSTPNVRVTLNFSEVADLTTVRARVEAVTNPGSGFEQTTDLSKNATDLQKEFEQFKVLVEGGAVGIVPVPNSLAIASVVAGGPADKAGIKAGDKLSKIAGQPLTNSQHALQLLTGAPGTTVEVEVTRGSETIAVTLTREPFAQVYAKR